MVGAVHTACPFRKCMRAEDSRAPRPDQFLDVRSSAGARRRFTADTSPPDPGCSASEVQHHRSILTRRLSSFPPLVPPLPRQHQQPHQQAVALAVATGGNGCGGGRGLSVALGGNGGRVAAPREPLAAAAAAAWHPAPPLPARAPLCGCERSWWGYLVAAARFGASERVGRGDAGPRAAAPTPGWWRVAVPAPPPLFPLSAGGALAGLRRPVKLRSAHAAPPLSCPSAASPRVALVGHRGVQHVPVGRGGRAGASAGGWGEGGMWKRRVTGNGEVACEWGWGEPRLR